MTEIPWLTILLATGFLVYSLYLLGKALLRFRAIHIGRTWPQTNGSVTSAEVITRNRGKGGRDYCAQVSYTYHLFGAEYQGQFIVEHFFSTKGAAEKSAAEHAVGSMLSVHYNPQKQQECLTEFDRVSVSELAGGLIGLAFALFLLWQVYTGNGLWQQ